PAGLAVASIRVDSRKRRYLLRVGDVFNAIGFATPRTGLSPAGSMLLRAARRGSTRRRHASRACNREGERQATRAARGRLVAEARHAPSGAPTPPRYPSSRLRVPGAAATTSYSRCSLRATTPA